jgi:hypothetical protein
VAAQVRGHDEPCHEQTQHGGDPRVPDVGRQRAQQRHEREGSRAEGVLRFGALVRALALDSDREPEGDREQEGLGDFEHVVPLILCLPSRGVPP